MQTVLAQATLRAADPAPERIRLRHVTLVPGRDALVVMEGRRPAKAPAAPAATYA
jgi:hypothetical protein